MSNYCRACNNTLIHQVIDLNKAPPSNAYIQDDGIAKKEVYLPLKVMVCEKCWLVQTIDFAQSNELFTENYAYLSSTSSSWLSHIEKFTKAIIEDLNLGKASFIVEVAANDGYLLQYFQERGIPNLGVEPTASTADIARHKGIEIVEDFFSEKLANQIASEYGKADLIIANNVFAHVPEILDFTLGIATLLKENGVVTIEVPHVLNLIESNQFDTIYHEHYSYLSLTSINYIFKKCKLKIVNVEKLNTHGGSIRVYGTLASAKTEINHTVNSILTEEKNAGMQSLSFYSKLSDGAFQCKLKLLDFLIKAKLKGEVTVAYGAAAKGNTLLNYAGIQKDLIEVVFDNSSEKQGKLMPGNNIPIKPIGKCSDYDIDNVLILPWNIAEELITSFKKQYPKDVKFYKAIPRLSKL